MRSGCDHREGGIFQWYPVRIYKPIGFDLNLGLGMALQVESADGCSLEKVEVVFRTLENGICLGGLECVPSTKCVIRSCM